MRVIKASNNRLFQLSRWIVLGTSVLALNIMLLNTPSFAQAVNQDFSPNGGPILKISPGMPSQWQAPITQQSSPSLPPVPSTAVSAANTGNKQPAGKSQNNKAASNYSYGPQSEAQSPSPNSALSVGTNARRIPAGTFLNVRFNTAMDSKTTAAGEPFTATLLEDFSANQQIVLPAGTLVRGRVDEVQHPTFFSKGGALFLAFDHVVLPNGDLMPLDLKLSTQNSKVNQQGAVYQDPGIHKKLGQSVNKGVNTFQKITDSGFKSGREIGDGLGTIITVPAAVIGGALAGTAVTTGNSAIAIVGKGETATITPGDTVRIDFGNASTIPLE